MSPREDSLNTLRQVVAELSELCPDWAHSGPGVQEARIARLERAVTAIIALAMAEETARTAAVPALPPPTAPVAVLTAIELPWEGVPPSI